MARPSTFRRVGLSLWYFLATVILLLALGGGGAYVSPVRAQDVPDGASDEAGRSVLDPRLRSAIADQMSNLGWELEAPAARSARTGKAGRPARFDVLIETSESKALRSAGWPLGSVFAEGATARLTARQLTRLSGHPAVQAIHSPARLEAHNDVAQGATGAGLVHRGLVDGTKYRGDGALTCIVDSGIDWRHLDFRGRADTTKSRITYLWDQTLDTQGGETTPAERGGSAFSGWDYGVEYTNGDIEAALDGTGSGSVRSEDIAGHGTHVAGSAAGHGASLPTGRYAGMAPAAPLAIVKAGNSTFSAANVIDGMNYCGALADQEGIPVVVNLSLGSNKGPHDGTSLQAEAVDGFVEEGTSAGAESRVVTVSSGNSGGVPIHREASVAAGDSVLAEIALPDGYSPQDGAENDDVKLDLWWSGSPTVTVKVLVADSLVAVLEGSGSDTTATSKGTVFLFSEIASQNGDRHLEVEIYDGDASNPPIDTTWSVRLINRSSDERLVHGWLYDRKIGESGRADLLQGNGQYTVATPATAERALTVASYVHRWRWTNADGQSLRYTGEDRSGAISAFSSRGPRRDSVRKPDLAAPGQGVGSALSEDWTSIAANRILPGKEHYIRQGTSMAAGVVAGAVALLLDARSSASAASVQEALTGTAQSDRVSAVLPNDAWGYGKVDVFAAVADLLGVERSRAILAYDEWGDNQALSADSTERFAVRFTPEIAGRVRGAFVHTGADLALTDSLRVSVWDDANGLPDTQVGDAVRIAADRFEPFTWNYLDLGASGETFGTDLQAGIDYHLVLEPTGSGADLRILGEGASPDNRSSRYRAGSWNSLSSDLRLRPEIATSGEATAVARGPADLPTRVRLAENYPNPFNPRTVIRYGLPAPGPVTLRIFDLLGREVARPVDGRRTAGWHQVHWHAGSLPSGLYFYRLETEAASRVQSMMLVR